VGPDEKADRIDEEHDARTDASDSDAERAVTAQETPPAGDRWLSHLLLME
jgi:hypothetical protein